MTCIHCGGSLKKNASKYCGNICQQAYQRKIKIDTWLAGGNPVGKYEVPVHVRTFLLEEAGYKCSQCSWSGTNPVSGNTVLTIDHIDGNATNNTRTNLRVLCPNCHAMTPTFGNLNRGNGRTWRYANANNLRYRYFLVSTTPGHARWVGTRNSRYLSFYAGSLDTPCHGSINMIPWSNGKAQEA